MEVLDEVILIHNPTFERRRPSKTVHFILKFGYFLLAKRAFPVINDLVRALEFGRILVFFVLFFVENLPRFNPENGEKNKLIPYDLGS